MRKRKIGKTISTLQIDKIAGKTIEEIGECW